MKCIFHSIVLNQSPCAFHLFKTLYFVGILSKNWWNLKPSNLKSIDIKKVHTEQTNTCSKTTTLETLEQGGKYKFKVKNKDIRMMSLTQFWCLYFMMSIHISHVVVDSPFVDFELENVC